MHTNLIGKYESMLADIRDMYPVPQQGSELEAAWAGAMACPEYVPAYVKECIAAILTPEQKQPAPNDKWCIGCNPDNCSGCGTSH